MPIVVKAGKVTNKTYAVSGKTLAEIWKDIEKKGPKDHGKNVAGLTETPVEIKIDGLKKFEVTDPKKPGKFQAKVVMDKGSVIYSGTILMPNLKSDKDLSKPAKAEWKRFITKLAAHEKEHITAAKGVATKIAAALNKISGVAEEDSKDKALKAAQKKMTTLYQKTFSSKGISDQIGKAHVALDKKKGVILKTTIK